MTKLLKRSWFVLLALAHGCGHLGEMTEPPADWPELKVIDYGSSGVIENCTKYSSILTWPPLGCAEVYFKEGICKVWHLNEWVRGEELKHCQGRDHQGETTLLDAWNAYKGAPR